MIREFEKASNNLNQNYPQGNENENVIEWVRGNDIATVCFSQKSMITKIKRLAEKYPNDFKVVAENKHSIVAHIPTKSIKINLPKRKGLTDEQKIKARERLQKARQNKLNNNDI